MEEQLTSMLPPLAEFERLDTVNEQIRLIQNKNGLTFGTDAFLLAAYVRSMSHAHAVELGGGTGIVSLLLLAKNKVERVSVAEVQPNFAQLIERNADLNGFADRLNTICCDVRTLTPKQIGSEVPLVFANPPYMKCSTGKRNEADEKYIARHEVCGTITDFCDCAGRLLKHGGKFVCVWRPDRLTDLLRAMEHAKLEPKRMIFVHADENAEPCSVLIEAIKGGAPSMRIAPPLFLYTPKDHSTNRALTVRAQKIYDTCSFDD